jgi:hypothetical protein
MDKEIAKQRQNIGCRRSSRRLRIIDPHGQNIDLPRLQWRWRQGGNG